MFIIDDLLIGLPVKSLIFIMKKIRDAVDQELTQEQRRKLLEIDDDLRNELINEQEYVKKELNIINENKKEK